MNINTEEVERTVSTFCPEQFTQIVLFDRTNQPAKVGYFSSPEELGQALEEQPDSGSVYFTPQRLHKGISARANGRFVPIKTATLVSDRDVTHYNWVLIDVDAVRPAGISSTNKEKEASKSVAANVSRFLLDKGWPKPAIGDSGNGFHLLFRTDLPTTKDNVYAVSQFLQQIAKKFDTEGAKIDTKVFNPSRIWRLYGTKTVKGDHTTERPHRFASLLQTPLSDDLVSLEQIQEIAGIEVSTAAGSQADWEEVVERWAEFHNFDVVKGKKGEKTKWTWQVCPLDETHDDSSAALIVSPSGHLTFKCFHTTCEKKTWADLDKRYPEYGKLWRTSSGGLTVGQDALFTYTDSERAFQKATQIINVTAQLRGTDNSGGGGTSGTGAIPVALAYGLNDVANGGRLVTENHQRLRHVGEWGEWLIWAGTHWERDVTNIVQERAKIISDKLLEEAAGVDDSAIKEKIKRFAGECANSKRISAAVAMAKSDVRVRVSAQDLDRNPYDLNLLNGTLDIKTRTLRPHSPHDLQLKLAKVEFDAQATCPRWLTFLDQIFLGDSSLIEYVQRAVGYSATGLVHEEKLFFGYGLGANGKSTFFNTLQSLMGDYAVIAAPGILNARANDPHPTDIADLKGARFAVINELKRGAPFDEERLKRLASRDKLKARLMHQNFFEFTPTHKLWVFGNHMPTLRGNDTGTWRRIMMIPFEANIPENQWDLSLPQKLAVELPGIFNWVLDGADKYLAGGLGQCDAVTVRTKAYRQEQDPLHEFLGRMCEYHPSYTSTMTTIYNSYLAWSEVQNERPFTKNMVSTMLTERGFPTKILGPRRVKVGLRVKQFTPQVSAAQAANVEEDEGFGFEVGGVK